jgi:Ankyrin repeats (many copies)
VEDNPGAIMEKNDDGYTPLHNAIEYRHPLEVVKYLAQQRPDALQERIDVGHLPLHLAATDQSPLDVVQFLTNSHPEALLETTVAGYTPLFCAVANRAPLEVAVFLAARCPPSLRVKTLSMPRPSSRRRCRSSNSSRTSSRGRCDRGRREADFEVLQFLAQEFPNALGEVDGRGELPLHTAAWAPSLEVVQWLVHAHPPALNIKTKDGRLPLHFAAQSSANFPMPRRSRPTRGGSRCTTRARWGGSARSNCWPTRTLGGSKRKRPTALCPSTPPRSIAPRWKSFIILPKCGPTPSASVGATKSRAAPHRPPKHLRRDSEEDPPRFLDAFAARNVSAYGLLY